MSCNYYRGKCLFLNGKEDGCKGCPIKKAYNKGVRDTKVDTYTIEDIQEVRENSLILGAKLAQGPTGEWIEDAFYYICPFCGMSIDDEVRYLYPDNFDLNFCPNCGKKLRWKGEEYG